MNRPPFPASPARGRGFTLLEVIVALVILGVASAATALVLVSTMRSNSDNRIRAQAVAAAEVWLDRFRAKTLDFSAFTAGVGYPYGYDYASDDTFVAAGDPDPAALNGEWQEFRFTVRTVSFSSSPLIWRIEVHTSYHMIGGKEASFDVATLVEQ